MLFQDRNPSDEVIHPIDQLSALQAQTLINQQNIMISATDRIKICGTYKPESKVLHQKSKR